jgi:Ohr subfamily peroxiredoxin
LSDPGRFGVGILPQRDHAHPPISSTADANTVLTHMKTVHIAEMIAQGGREGRVEAADGGLKVELSGNEENGSVTPEHLFAGAYAACFLGALKGQAGKANIPIENGSTVVGRAHLEEDEHGGYHLQVELRASLPGVKRKDAEHLMNLAHQSCPYSKATRGNVTVKLTFD